MYLPETKFLVARGSNIRTRNKVLELSMFQMWCSVFPDTPAHARIWAALRFLAIYFTRVDKSASMLIDLCCGWRWWCAQAQVYDFFRAR